MKVFLIRIFYVIIYGFVLFSCNNFQQEQQPENFTKNSINNSSTTNSDAQKITENTVTIQSETGKNAENTLTIQSETGKIAENTVTIQSETGKNTENTFTIQPVPKEYSKNNSAKNICINNILDMNFVYIQPGSFTMGTSFQKKDIDEIPHTVNILQGFYMQTTEVTQDQWKKVMGSNPSYFSNCGDTCPVERVSWYDVQEFIKKLNKQDKNYTYNLPTEAQWEYAAKAGKKTQFYWGNNPNCLKANFGNSPEDNYNECSYNPGKTVQVNSFVPNKWGLYNMHGNVSEWCQDWYAPYSVDSVVTIKTNSRKVIRGGAFNDKTINCRSSNRLRIKPDMKINNIGFRLIIDDTLGKEKNEVSDFLEQTQFTHQSKFLSPFLKHEERYKDIFTILKQGNISDDRIYEIFSSKRSKQKDLRPIKRMSKRVISKLSKRSKSQIRYIVKKIVKHLKKHKKYYDILEKQYGVNREICASILFKETALGKFNNWQYESFTVLNSIVGFMEIPENNQNKRIERIISTSQRSLADLILYCHRYEIDILEKRFPSSFAGAIGVVQFLPMYLEYALSFDDTVPDLTKISDGIISLGHIFKEEFNWPPALIDYDNLKNIDKIREKYLIFDEQNKGATLCHDIDLDGKQLKPFISEIVDIPNIDYICLYAKSIMHYNFSSVYVLDVLQFAYHSHKVIDKK